MPTLALTKKLLSIFQSEEQDFRPSKMLNDFCEDYGVGQRVGSVWRFSQTHKAKIATYLQNEAKVNPYQSLDAWEGESRHGALKKGGDEKLTTKRLRGKRVAVKALPGRPLLLGPAPIHLPPGASLDLDRQWVVEHCTHDSVLLIENWENFELTHETPLLERLPGNPLVVFRGAPGSYKTDSSQALLAELKLPVVAFTDYDPEGLCIAATLPGFSRYLAPSDECLNQLMVEINTERRYQKQVAGKLAFLESLTDPELVRVYRIVRTAGKALPQEKLIGLDVA
ncbi:MULTISPECIES: DUF7281 domain-containing protein [Pseudomonas]|uniref:DUF7281 domain-containing protein n=1 Tax=Pseudomonas mosselii TaxID=78327 RepID=A0A5R8ZHA6_9PSED|nr:hypothetical protein [Pseudomonas mosselii]TLP65153.1 hypothetical protein FEM01_02955 [Pseudomonas mosselii]